MRQLDWINLGLHTDTWMGSCRTSCVMVSHTISISSYEIPQDFFCNHFRLGHILWNTDNHGIHLHWLRQDHFIDHTQVKYNGPEQKFEVWPSILHQGWPLARISPFWKKKLLLVPSQGSMCVKTHHVCSITVMIHMPLTAIAQYTCVSRDNNREPLAESGSGKLVCLWHWPKPKSH